MCTLPVELLYIIHRFLGYDDRKSFEAAFDFRQPIIHRIAVLPSIAFPRILQSDDQSSVRLKIASKPIKFYIPSYSVLKVGTRYIPMGWENALIDENGLLLEEYQSMANGPEEYSELAMTYTQHQMDLASRAGNVEDLQRFLEDGSTTHRWTSCSIDSASFCGHVHVLDWWKNSGLECQWTYRSMDIASRYGEMQVLEWWKNSGLECRWTSASMIYASVYGHIDVLNWWWHQSGLECKWSDDQCLQPSNATEIVDWWKNVGLQSCRNKSLLVVE